MQTPILKPLSSHRRVTLAQVAEAAGLGRTTVSDILNRNVGENYSAETRDRVREAVRNLGYAPVRAAQQLARGRSGQLGLMLTRDFSNPFFARVADLIEREVRNLKYRLQIAVTDGDPATELDRIRQFQGDAVEGLIVGPVYEPLDVQQHRNVFRGGLPIVLFGGEFDCEFDQVTNDRDEGVAVGLAYLLGKGHRRIGFLCAPPSQLRPDQPNPDFRSIAIYRENGVYDDQWFFWQPDTGRFEDFYRCCLAFANKWQSVPADRRPTAVLCHNDQAAMTALAAFHAAGIRVPDDLSVVGYDNLPESAYFTPALTTIDNHVDQQMRQTVKRLLHRIAEPDAEKQVETIPPTLVERGSVKTISTVS